MAKNSGKIVPLRKTIKDITQRPKPPRVKVPTSSDSTVSPTMSRGGMKQDNLINLPGIKT